MDNSNMISVIDTQTGEVLVKYVPKDKAYAVDLIKALQDIKRRISDLMSTKQALEKAFLDACPQGYKSPEATAYVDINLTKDAAKDLVAHGFGSCVGISESVRYRLLKNEVKKFELVQDKYNELMQLLDGCSRTIRITDGPEEVEV